jgi:hypothetical protein
VDSPELHPRPAYNVELMTNAVAVATRTAITLTSGIDLASLEA